MEILKKYINLLEPLCPCISIMTSSTVNTGSGREPKGEPDKPSIRSFCMLPRGLQSLGGIVRGTRADLPTHSELEALRISYAVQHA